MQNFLGAPPLINHTLKLYFSKDTASHLRYCLPLWNMELNVESRQTGQKTANSLLLSLFSGNS
jgi:hypothetical protein